MSVSRKIAQHTFWQFIGKFLSTILGIITIGLLTRYLDPKGFGQYTTVFAFLQLFGILVDFGLYIVLINRLSASDHKDDEIVSNVFTLRFVSAIIFLGLAPLIALFIPSYDHAVKLGIGITALAMLGVTMIQLLTAVFQKHIATGKVALAEVIGRSVLLGITFIMISLDFGLLFILCAVVISNAVHFFITFHLSRRYVRIRLAMDFLFWRSIIKEAWPVALSIFFNLAYFKADTIFLSLMKSQEEVGLYGAAYKILEVLITFPTMFVGLILPILAKNYVSKNKEKFFRILQQSFECLAMIAMPIIIVGTFMAEPIVMIVGGEKFAGSIPILRILIWAVGIIYIGTLFGYLIVVIQKQKIMLWGYGFVALTSLIGYVIFIPKYSVIGAAAMTVYSEAAISTIIIFMVIKTTRSFFPLWNFLKILGASIGFGAVLAFTQALHPLISLTLGALVYIGGLFLTGVVTKDQMNELFQKQTNQ